jgi:hypothetical protein
VLVAAYVVPVKATSDRIDVSRATRRRSVVLGREAKSGIPAT